MHYPIALVTLSVIADVIGFIVGSQSLQNAAWWVLLSAAAIALLGDPMKSKRSSDRSYTTIDDVMRPLDKLHTISPDMPVNDVLERMARENLNQLPVVRNGQLEGVISRSHILRLLQNTSGTTSVSIG